MSVRNHIVCKKLDKRYMHLEKKHTNYQVLDLQAQILGSDPLLSNILTTTVTSLEIWNNINLQSIKRRNIDTDHSQKSMSRLMSSPPLLTFLATQNRNNRTYTAAELRPTVRLARRIWGFAIVIVGKQKKFFLIGD